MFIENIDNEPADEQAKRYKSLLSSLKALEMRISEKLRKK